MRIGNKFTRPIIGGVALLILFALVGIKYQRNPAMASSVRKSPGSAPPPLAASGTFSNFSPITINDSFSPPTLASPYPSNITVTDISTVTKITVNLVNYRHSFPDDVDVLLVGPTGATCLLMADSGGSDFIIPGVNLTFDDNFPSLPDNSQITTGTYKPTKGTSVGGGDNSVPANFPAPAPPGPYGTSLSIFNGSDPNGTWRLYVIDDSAGDSGVIQGGWSFAINNPVYQYQGSHEVADCSVISGWAWDANQPNTPISVDIYDGSTFRATVAADQFRQDLQNSGIGNGVHGFSFATPFWLKDGQFHTIRVRFASSIIDLAGTPKTLTCNSSYQGTLEAANCSVISGWAWDANQPNTPISVDIYDGSNFITTVAADQFRQDLQNSGIGNGAHGFSLPNLFHNGLSHSVHVKFHSSNVDLAFSPQTYTCGPKGTDTAGLYAPNYGAFFLRNSNTGGNADIMFNYGPANAGWIPIKGDWNGDVVDTIGLYNPATATFSLRNSNTGGTPDISFTFGPANAGFIPIVGDWDGDGTDTVGLYDPSNAAFFLRNSNAGGVADISFTYGPANAGFIPIVGDWDGNGTDTIGLYDPANAAFFLRNSNTGGVADISFTYGPANAGFIPIVGDWNNDGVDTIGIYGPAYAAFFLRNSNTGGVADISFTYGPANAGWIPLAGNWDGL